LPQKIRRLIRDKSLFGTVGVNASYPSDVWVNGQYVGLVTPIAKLELPHGTYAITVVNARYHLARQFHTEVVSGRHQAIVFPFGVLRVSLQPWARITAGGRDLGLWDELGLPAGMHELVVTSHDGKKKAQADWKIAAGQTSELTWERLERKAP